jgi:putative ABC transport system ATP-binding protein
MQHALDMGNRLIMMDQGSVIMDVSGEEKKALTIEGLLNEFQRLRGATFANDRAVLG